MNTLREILSHVNKVERVDFLGPCWEWMGYTDGKGYGRTSFRGQMLRAHRLMFGLFVGPVDEVCVCHICDNRLCCNPEHLFAGTRSENIKDAKSKGRTWHPTGDRNGRARLVYAQVTEIRHARDAGISQGEIAIRFGISQQQVSKIVAGKRWNNV